MNKQDITINEVFDKWYAYLRDNPNERYLHASRPEILKILAEYLIKYDIPYIEAKMFTKKVIETLTTPEGRKGKGKYQGWKEHVEKDYHAVLADYYIENIDKEVVAQKKSPVVKENDSSTYIYDNTLITAWTKNKFSDNWNEDLNREAHLVGSYLNLLFINEVFGSDYAKGLKEEPQWIKEI